MHYKHKQMCDQFYFLAATEAAAIAASALRGLGDKYKADQVAVNAMRLKLNALPIKGRIVIGEGTRDNAPMLFQGEYVGINRHLAQIHEFDIAVDPLEGTDLLANGSNDALSVMAITNHGHMLNAPDVYMDKIAIGIDYNEQIIDLDNTPKQNLMNIAKIKGCDIGELTTVILNRSRHEELIAKVKEAGSKVQLIQDGDVSAIIQTSKKYYTSSNVDVYMGIGGAPEGVLAAAALKTCGGQMCARLLFDNNHDKIEAQKCEITDLSKKYLLSDLISSDALFIATGVTDGVLLQGVQNHQGQIVTNSVIMDSKNRIITNLTTNHYDFILNSKH